MAKRVLWSQDLRKVFTTTLGFYLILYTTLIGLFVKHEPSRDARANKWFSDKR